VSRNSVRLAFLIAALNNIDIMACDDLENAYLNAPCQEKIWFEGGIECGEDQGKVYVVVCPLYGLKSAGQKNTQCEGCVYKDSRKRKEEKSAKKVKD
jgi:hypothetical protein